MAKTFQAITKLDPRNVLIVDALNFAFRFRGENDYLKKYMDNVRSFAQSFNCGKVIIAADWGSSSYRKEIYPEYKANRKEKFAVQTEEETQIFLEFMNELSNILETYAELGSFPVLRFKNVEADDIASYIVKNRSAYNIAKVHLLSSDRDWDLLISDDVSRFSYASKKEFTMENWRTHYNYNQEDHISVKVLMGDPGDNIMGVPSVGPVKAVSLVQEYGSAYDVAASLPISSKYKYIQNLNSFGSENILLNYRLMDLLEFCDEAIGPDNCKTIDEVLSSYLASTEEATEYADEEPIEELY